MALANLILNQDDLGQLQPSVAGGLRSLVPNVRQQPANNALLSPNPNPVIPHLSQLQEPTGLMPNLGGLPPLTSMRPVANGGLRPLVTNPQNDAWVAAQQAERANAEKMAATPTGITHATTPAHGFWQHLGRIAEGIGNVAGDIFAPATMSLIPGTQLNRLGQQERGAEELANFQKQDIETQDAASRRMMEGAQTAEAGARTEGLRQELAEEPEITQSEIDYRNAQAAALLHPQAKTDFEAWQQQNPGKPIEEWLKTVAANKPTPNTPQEQAFNDYLKQGLTPGQAWEKIREKPAVIGGGVSLARSDKSFQYNQGELDKLTNPISQLAARMGRLQDTLAQNNQQSDALVAPELLTVMAGGQGSGLRMNEAEIARVIGGATAWTRLKTAINRWSTDPNSARFTPVQHQQIRDLVQTVSQKLNAKQNILNQAAGDLVNSDDPKEHRQITQRARMALNAIDEGQGSGLQVPPKVGDVRDGYRYKGGNVNNPASWELVKK